MRKAALLALADGSIFRGVAIGIDGQVTGEVVFNTAMTGYQEILTDPSYARQIVTLTCPHIGNVGTNAEDEEAANHTLRRTGDPGPAVLASNWRSESRFEDYLLERGVVGIAGIDTRRLTRILREKGAQNGCIMAGGNLDADAAVTAARAFPGLVGMDLAKEVTTAERYEWRQGTWSLASGLPAERPVEDLEWHVVAYDYGIKRNILRMLVERGCRVTVVPARTAASEVLGYATRWYLPVERSGRPGAL